MSASTKEVKPTEEDATATEVEFNIEDFEHLHVHVEKGGMARKLEQAAPYNMFLTTVPLSQATHEEPLSVTMQELLDESLGEIEASVQINFIVDIDWLQGHYHFAGILDKPLLVLHGWKNYKTEKQKPQVTSIKIEMASEFATSHTKLMLFGYKDGSMRVVISTANLRFVDWLNATQSLWISPTLPALAGGTESGESATGFRGDLMHYLATYKLDELQPWIDRIGNSDFSAVK
ncbi:hypothetical protein KR222_004882 [Zaprionus bogoriensis]|nr:hypothetical protein KR222_004882 [Zaprionus bogoriensis]